MKLSTRSRFGARILLELVGSSQKNPVPVSHISKKQEISVKYVEQLMRPLKTKKLVKSVRGPKGGHWLSKDPQKISLGDVVRIFEKNSEIVDCITNPNTCHRSGFCKIREAWTIGAKAFFDKLDSIFIADLVDK